MISDKLERLFDPVPADAGWPALLDGFFRNTLTRDAARALGNDRCLPGPEFHAFAQLGLTEWVVPRAINGKLEWSTLTRLCARMAEQDLAATLCFGGTVLGALPVALAGTTAQMQQYFSAVRKGEMGGLALSEWGVGSDLNASATQAVAVAGGFEISGEKAPINNGGDGANVVVLARTHAESDAFSSSLFLLGRGQQGLRPYPKVPWMGTRVMDLSGAVLEKACVGPETLLGKAGEGFVWVRRTLEISRSGVAAMGLGAAARAIGRGFAHAHERKLYGAEIGALGGVQQLLGAAAARTLLIFALGRFAAHAVSEAQQAARAWTGAAKLVCTRGAEEIVAHTGTVLGARSLVSEFDFEDLRRNVALLPIFDGSSQLQLDELWRATSTWKRAPMDVDPRALFASAHGDLREARDESLVLRNNVVALLEGCGELSAIAAWLGENAGRIRGLTQPEKFEASELVALLHAYAALRAAIACAQDSELLEMAWRAALAEDAPRIAAHLAALAETRFHAGLLALAAPKLAARKAMFQAMDALLSGAG